MKRKLASIQVIKSLDPVYTRTGEEALNLALATFEGVEWAAVVRRAEFTVGEKCIYIEISSIVPNDKNFSFMEKDRFVVKTKKFVGTTLSQGLVMPFSILFDYLSNFETLMNLEAGDDVSHIIGVERHEPVEVFGTTGETAGLFPLYILPKTDETRLQSSPLYLNLLKGRAVTATVKIHGTSATYWIEDGKFRVASRNLEVRDGDNVYWEVARRYDLPKKLSAYPNWVLQGEIAGPGICDNFLGLRAPNFFAFNIWDRVVNNYVSQDTFELYCRMINIPHVPILKRWESFDETLETLLELADKTYDSGRPMEGIVLRPTDEVLYDPRLGRISCKVINNKFLLKGGT